MRPLSAILFCLAFVAPVCIAQTAPAANPASAPAPRPVIGATAAPGGGSATIPNAAAASVAPRSEAGATERGLAPTAPVGTGAGVTQRVRQANVNDVDASGHTLDSHGRPVGQAPAAAGSVH